MYDVIIVGAGMAGLFAAYKIKKRRPHASILLLEKNGKIGGRADTELFHGTPIQIGAGIGRFHKDRLLLQLMRELHLPIKTFASEHYSLVTKEIDVKATMHRLQDAYKRGQTGQKEHTTFAVFARRVLGNADYQRFLSSTGFTDYQEEDAYETLFEYGMEDNLEKWKAFSVPWRLLEEHLLHSIGPSHFALRKEVTHILPTDDGNFQVTTKNKRYQAKKVVVATTIDTLRRLFPQNPLYDQIEGQPFLRVYGKFDKASIAILQDRLQGMTYVDFPIQKIIPMNVEKGVYMIVYNDNQSALELKGRTENTEANCRFYERALEKVLQVSGLHLIDIRAFYWDIGTHYYKPLKNPSDTRESFMTKAQRPADNIFVVGELVSRNQGWTEGCLESVMEVLPEILHEL